MKHKSLLLALSCSVLVLAGCSNNSSTSAISSDPALSSEPTASSIGNHGDFNPYSDFEEWEDTSEEFPIQVVNDFLAYFDMEVELPAPVGGTSWNITHGTHDGLANLYLDTEDKGTPGVDAMEDTYKALLESKGFVVSDEEYDDIGYNVTVEEFPDFELYFYSFYGYFIFDLSGPFTGHLTQGYPTYFATEYVKTVDPAFEEKDLVVPDSNALWSSYVYESFETSYCAFTENGTAKDVTDYHAKLSAVEGVEITDLAVKQPNYFEAPAYLFNYTVGDVSLSIYAYLDVGAFWIETYAFLAKD